MYALSFLYDPSFQRYVAEDNTYLKNTDIEEIFYLLRIHSDSQALSPDMCNTT
jgi:hypothetical protein